MLSKWCGSRIRKLRNLQFARDTLSFNIPVVRKNSCSHRFHAIQIVQSTKNRVGHNFKVKIVQHAFLRA